MSSVLTVSQVNTYIKSLVDENPVLSNMMICGEISNFTNHYKSGHLYFSLKDQKSVIKAVMFSSDARRLRFMPSEGMKVIVSGRISVYEPSGAYQVYVRSMQPDGLGALNLAYEQLKAKLEAEGLFSRKRPLPTYPAKIAVITSDTGAAVQDIFNILKRRWPVAQVELFPSLVQGSYAEAQLIEQLSNANTSGADVIIIGRGGGSIEDLWCFNSEKLARAIYSSEIPVISAVGHETDFTICDFVSDLRAPTPSAAAELAVPNIVDVRYEIENLNLSLRKSVTQLIDYYKEFLDRLSSSVALLRPELILEPYKTQIKDYNDRMLSQVTKTLDYNRFRFQELVAALDALSPLKTMSRGYAYITKWDGHVSSVNNINAEDIVKIHFADGYVSAEVNDIRKEIYDA